MPANAHTQKYVKDPVVNAGKEVAGSYLGSSIDLAATVADFINQFRPATAMAIIKRVLSGEDPDKVFNETVNTFKNAAVGAKKAADKATGLPISEAGPDTPENVARYARMAGSGAAGAVTLGAGAAGSIAGLITAAVNPQSESGKFLVNLAANLAVPGIASGVRHNFSGASRPPVEPPAGGIPTTRSAAGNTNRDIPLETRLAQSTRASDTPGMTIGDKVADWEKKQGIAVKGAIEKSFGKPYEALVKDHDAATARDFGSVSTLIGDKKFIFTTNLRLALQDTVKKLEANGTPAMQAKAKQFNEWIARLRANPKMSAEGYKKTVEELNQVIYGKGDIFTEIAPGSGIGDAKRLAKAMRQDLEVTAHAAPNALDRHAADLFNQARAKFSDRVSTLEAYQSWMQAGTIKGASERQPNFSIFGALQQIDKDIEANPKLLERIFPDAAERANFQAKVAQMRKTINDYEAATGTKASDLLVQGGAQALTGHAGAGRLAGGAEVALKSLLMNQDVAFQALFNPTVKAGTVFGKILQMPGLRQATTIAKQAVNPEVSNVAPNVAQNQHGAVEAGAEMVDKALAPSTPTPAEPSDDEVFQKYMESSQAPATPTSPSVAASEEDDDVFLNVLADTITQVESNYKNDAVSSKGAVGPAQFMEATAKQYGLKDRTDPAESRRAQLAMLKDLSKKYNGDLDKILAGYNWGQGNVDRQGMEKAPEETRKYIATVRSKLNALSGTTSEPTE